MSHAAGLILFALAILVVTRRLTLPRRIGAVAVGLGVPLALAVPVLRESQAPRDLSETPYEASNACKRCHPDHYASWHRSYHRTMTTEASPLTVKGDFADARATFYGVESRMFREGDSFFLETVDPEWARRARQNGFDLRDVRDQRKVTWRVDLAIGSHNYQQYATKMPSGAIIRLPLAWHLVEKRWVHMNGVFLQPEDDYFHTYSALWNANCIFCHNVKARPRLSDDSLANIDHLDLAKLPVDSQVEEYGIACEACHGPGEEHTRAHTNVARRYFYEGRADPTIVNPARLDKVRSAEVCGHCHSFHTPVASVATERLQSGDPYTPGEDLSRYVRMQTPGDFHDVGPMTLESNFWPDGTIKRTSIEYLGLLESPCYQRGEMTCLSCHDSHGDDPVDQLAVGARTNRPCVACHPAFVTDAALTEHTHHAPESSGSLCYNCHMPNVVWGLLRGMRSHRIITPSVATTVATGLPHACNQCHLDRSLAWTRDQVERMYGEAPAPVDADDQVIVASLVQLLRGDAAQRALSAWTFGWDDARGASGAEWAPHFLLLTMADDYPAVRLSAFRSLRTYAPIQTDAFDYLAEPDVRARQIAELRTRLAVPDLTREPVRAEAAAAGDQIALNVDRSELRAAADLPDGPRTRDLLARQDRRRLHISE